MAADLINLILEATNCGKPVVQDPQRLRPVNSEVRALLADSSRLHREAGWQPRVRLYDGLERTINWWRDRIDRGLVRRDAGFST